MGKKQQVTVPTVSRINKTCEFRCVNCDYTWSGTSGHTVCTNCNSVYCIWTNFAKDWVR